MKKKLAIYLLVAFGFSWAMQALGILLGTKLGAVWFTALNAVGMYGPFLGTLFACGGLKNERTGVLWRPVFKGKLKWWFASLWGPAVFSITGAALFFALLPGRFDAQMTTLSAMLPAGSSVPGWVIAAANTAQALTWAPFLNMIFALGEEVGWRGFLAPLLCQKLGRKKGLVLTGVIWGAWHWPVICLAGYNYGSGYPGAPFTGAAMMCLACVALGVLLSFVYDRAQSIWAPALFHGAFNAAAGLGALFLAPGVTSMILGPAPLGLLGGVPMFTLAAWALLAKRRPDAE